MEKTERIQYQAVLAITSAWPGSCRSKLYEELEWESLPDRRWCRRILEIVSGKTPSYLKNKLPQPFDRQSNSNPFHELKCKSLRYTSSFFPDKGNNGWRGDAFWRWVVLTIILYRVYDTPVKQLQLFGYIPEEMWTLQHEIGRTPASVTRR